MNLPKLAVARPVTTCMLFLGLLILGAVSFTRLQIDLLPAIDFPSISVVTEYPGAGPEETETLITRPVERAVSGIEGVDRIESFSVEGRSRVALRFDWGTDLDVALNDVRAVVERARDDLPEDAQAPVIYKFNIGALPVMYLGLSGKLDEPALRQLAERRLGPRLERVEGVASVSVRGGLKRQVQILLDPRKLQTLRVDAATVRAALGATNRNTPAGPIDDGDKTVLVRTLAEAETVSAFQDMIVARRPDADGTLRPIRLREVARVVDAFEEPDNVVRINGQPGIRLSVLKQSGANTVAVCERVRAELEAVNRDLQGKARLDIVTDTSTYIENSIASVQNAVGLGAALAILVLLVFLRRLRPTLIIAVSIPVSIVGIFTLMFAFDLTLNLISFGGVALGVGMLVDNAIVILENIYRKHEDGLEAEEAAVEGSREVAQAIVASTMTTLVVFLPVIFLSGKTAILFGEMAFVVSLALLCSLAVSLTLVPMLASRLLGSAARPSSTEEAETSEETPAAQLGALSGSGRAGVLERAYGRAVDMCLNRPLITLAVAVALLAGALGLAPTLGTELLPTSDQSEVNVNMELPTGTRLEVTEAAVRELEAVILDGVPELTAMQTVVGTPGFWSTSGGESARISLKLVSPGERKRSSAAIAATLRGPLKARIPGANVRVSPGGGLWVLRVLRGGGERLEVEVQGFDLDRSAELADEVRRRVLEVDGITGARVDRKEGGVELLVRPRREALALLGLSADDVAQQLQTYVQGSRASTFRADGDAFDVLVRLDPAWRANPELLLQAPILTPTGSWVVLRDVVRVERAQGPLSIARLNQRRITKVTTVLDEARPLSDVARDVRATLAEMDVPDTFSVAVKGESEEQRKSFTALLTGILLAIVLVYMVMASQFESLVQPLLIMASIPLATVGVVVSLKVTGTTFNLQSFMGCVVLVGIVVNNAIVLIDYINLMRRERGLSIRQAIRLSARRRLRPILMTTATTLLALLPVAIGLGEGSETQAPLARVVVGGLLVSMLISLVVVPVLYDMVEGRLERRRLRREASVGAV